MLPPHIEAAWGNRLYGCDSCLEACPHFQVAEGVSCVRGRLGPGLPAAWLAGASDSELKERFRGTVLGQAWISQDALRRNARLADLTETGKKT